MSSIIDDAQFNYSGSWSHADDGSANLVEGTQSWTNEQGATFSFTFSGTGFDFCAGLKADRGAFTYSIGVSHGAGTELGDTMEVDPVCQIVASSRNLASGTHQVVFTNAGNSYFAADAITIYTNNNVANGGAQQQQSSTSTSSSQTSTSTRSSSSHSFSTTSLTSVASLVSLSSSSAPSSASTASAQAQSQDGHADPSAGRKAALIGAPIIAGIILAVLGFFIWTRCKRRREEGSMAIAPSASTHYLDEKSDRFLGPTDRSFSPMQFAGRISPIQFGKNKTHARLNSEMSLESHTEPFQPAPLRSPPIVEPFTLPAGDFQEYASSNLNPTKPAKAVVARQSSYEDRLTAVTKKLPSWMPDWRISKANTDASIYPESTYPKSNMDADRLSTYSALYEGMLDEDDSGSHEAAPVTGKNKYR